MTQFDNHFTHTYTHIHSKCCRGFVDTPTPSSPIWMLAESFTAYRLGLSCCLCEIRHLPAFACHHPLEQDGPLMRPHVPSPHKRLMTLERFKLCKLSLRWLLQTTYLATSKSTYALWANVYVRCAWGCNEPIAYLNTKININVESWSNRTVGTTKRYSVFYF